MKRDLSPQLKVEIEDRIKQLESENKYIEDFFKGIGSSGGVSSVAGATGDKEQIGTAVPVWYGMQNTFIANPSNVGIGIVARMIETDETVKSSVQFKSLMMLSKIGEYQHEDPELAKFVNDFLNSMRGPTWAESKEAQSSSFAYGFSISEIIWGLNKKNQKVPVRVKTYHPSTICFEVDPYGDVTEEGVVQFVVQNAQFSNPNTYFPYFQYGFQVKNPFETPNDRLLPYRMPFIANYGLARIPKDKVIHHVECPMLSFGSPYGKTPVRTVHLAWQMKVFFMRQMGIAGKRQASPFVWGTAPHNQNKVRVKNPDTQKFEDLNPIEALTEILRSRSTDDSVVTGPESIGYKLQAITSQTNLDQFLNVIDHLNTYIFRGFLLPSLVMTDGSAGSRALGDKHFQIVDRIAEEDAKKFGETIINQLIRPAIEKNFGEQENYGHFAQRPQNIEERERLSNMFTTLANSGYMKAFDKTDGEYVRSTLHLPKQEESFYQAPMPNFDPIDTESDEQPDKPAEEVDGNKAE